jgi:hypothetical protein
VVKYRSSLISGLCGEANDDLPWTLTLGGKTRKDIWVLRQMDGFWFLPLNLLDLRIETLCGTEISDGGGHDDDISSWCKVVDVALDIEGGCCVPHV